MNLVVSNQLLKHITRHLNTKKHQRNCKPFICESCDETFTLKSSLDRHIEKFCNPTQKLKNQIAERDKTIEELKKATTSTINNYNTNIQCNIYNMPPKSSLTPSLVITPFSANYIVSSYRKTFTRGNSQP